MFAHVDTANLELPLSWFFLTIVTNRILNPICCSQFAFRNLCLSLIHRSDVYLPCCYHCFSSLVLSLRSERTKSFSAIPDSLTSPHVVSPKTWCGGCSYRKGNLTLKTLRFSYRRWVRCFHHPFPSPSEPEKCTDHRFDRAAIEDRFFPLTSCQREKTWEESLQ